MACETATLVTAVPDGATATREQMIEAQEEIKAYMAAMEEYLACLNEEIEAAGEEAPAEFKSLMVARHDTSVVEMEEVAKVYNEQLAAFNAANAAVDE
jgi:hypothetical protein